MKIALVAQLLRTIIHRVSDSDRVPETAWASSSSDFSSADTYSHLHVREGYIMQMSQTMVEDLVALCKCRPGRNF